MSVPSTIAEAAAKAATTAPPLTAEQLDRLTGAEFLVEVDRRLTRLERRVDTLLRHPAFFRAPLRQEGER